ncbi:MAG: hypothetical protein CL883_05520 [Dehalococcoidia bacterium]|nr:hypothetical protein [Dehalococcoidia bacterium]|tara:strand:+ start:978 stop:1286 length:309 start_codon:yes stop_codon:yes gene_type:complete
MKFLEKIAEYPDAHGFMSYLCSNGLLDKINHDFEVELLYEIYSTKGYYSHIVKLIGKRDAAILVEYFTKNSVPYFLNSINSVDVANMYIELFRKRVKPEEDI